MTTDNFDLEPAVVACRALLLEAHTNEERLALVWNPTNALLGRLAKTKPNRLTCFSGAPYQLRVLSCGLVADVHLVSPERTVYYFGTVYSPDAYRANQTQEIARLQIRKPEAADLIASLPPTAIIRTRCHCIIPANQEELNLVTLTAAVRYYFCTYPKLVRSLAELPIAWLAPNVGHRLNQEIFRQAEQTARHSLEDEHYRKIMEDER